MLSQVPIGEKFGSRFGVGGGEGATLGDLVSIILQASFAISGLIVLFMFIFAGYSLISGAGRDNPEQAAKGKQAATWAVVGFIVVFVAYWVIRIIEAITGLSFITLNP